MEASYDLKEERTLGLREDKTPGLKEERALGMKEKRGFRKLGCGCIVNEKGVKVKFCDPARLRERSISLREVANRLLWMVVVKTSKFSVNLH
jgi:hypothetical protein